MKRVTNLQDSIGTNGTRKVVTDIIEVLNRDTVLDVCTYDRLCSLICVMEASSLVYGFDTREEIYDKIFINYFLFSS